MNEQNDSKQWICECSAVNPIRKRFCTNCGREMPQKFAYEIYKEEIRIQSQRHRALKGFLSVISIILVCKMLFGAWTPKTSEVERSLVSINERNITEIEDKADDARLEVEGCALIHGHFSDSDTVDIFCYTPTEDDLLRIRVLDKDGNETDDFVLGLFDENGNFIEGDSNFLVPDGVANVKGVETGEKYLIQVKQLRNENEYSLWIYNRSADDVTGYNRIKEEKSFPNQLNKYAYTAPRTGVYGFIMEVPQNYDAEFSLKNSEGDNLIICNFESTSNCAYATLSEGETYYISTYLQGYDTSDVIIYEAPEPIKLKWHRKVKDTVDYRQYEKTYSLNVKKGNEYRINVKRIKLSNDIDICVRNSNGELIAYEENIKKGILDIGFMEEDQEIQISIHANGKYKFKIIKS